MSAEDVELSKSGIKLSYRRFLSDNAGGYSLILICIMAFLYNAPIPFSHRGWREVFSTSVPTDFKVILGLLVILLATPLGLAINAISWLTLGWPQIYLVDVWARIHQYLPFLFYSTTRDYNYKQLQNCFQFLSGNTSVNSLHDQGYQFEELLRFYYPDEWASLDHVAGVRQFARSLSLISLALMLYAVPLTRWWIVLAFFSLSLALIIFTSILEFYGNLATLNKVYVICRKDWRDDPWKPRTFEDVVNTLIASRAKHASA